MDQADPPWILVGCQFAFDVGANGFSQFVGILTVPGFARNHKGFDAQKTVGFGTNDHGIVDQRMVCNALLNFQRSHPLAADFEQRVCAAAKLEIAVIIDSEEIACTAPVTVKGAPALVAILKIALGYAVALHPHNARLSGS